MRFHRSNRGFRPCSSLLPARISTATNIRQTVNIKHKRATLQNLFTVVWSRPMRRATNRTGASFRPSSAETRGLSSFTPGSGAEQKVENVSEDAPCCCIWMLNDSRLSHLHLLWVRRRNKTRTFTCGVPRSPDHGGARKQMQTQVNCLKKNKVKPVWKFQR